MDADQILDHLNKIRKDFFKKWPIRVLAVLLILCLGVHIFLQMRNLQAQQMLDVKYTNKRPDSYSDDYGTTSTLSLARHADVIYEGVVVDISFEVKNAQFSTVFYLDTIYTVAVTRTYKGDTQFLETIRVSNGLQDYCLQEQLDAIRQAGAPEDYRKINVSNASQAKIGSTYLFYVSESSKHPERWGYYSNFAVSTFDSLFATISAYDYLPNIPHPILIISLILLTLNFVVTIKKKEGSLWKMPKS